MDRFPIAETVNLNLTIESSGTGVTGETPTAVVQRLTDGFYFDDAQATGLKFAAAFATNAMTEVDATNLPGLYRVAFDHSEDLTTSELFFVRLQNTGGNARIEDSTIAFGPLRVAAALDQCALFGTVVDINGQGDANKVVRVSIIPNTILTTGSKPGVSVDKLDTYTDDTGGFSINLLRNLTIRLQIPSMGYDRKIVIPDAPSANFADL